MTETEEATNEEPHKPDKPVEQVGKRKNKNKNKYQEITVGPTTVGQAIAEVSEVEANGYSTFHGKTNITNWMNHWLIKLFEVAVPDLDYPIA